MRKTYGIYKSCRREKLLARIPWFLGRWNRFQTNTPFGVDQHYRSFTLNVFGKGRSARLTRDQQFMSEHFEWIFQESCYGKGASNEPGLSTLHLDKKHLQKRHRIFGRDREPSRIPAQTHNVWETRAERLENMFLLFTNVSVRVHLSKTLWETL